MRQQYRVYVGAIHDRASVVDIAPHVPSMLKEARDLDHYVVGEIETFDKCPTCGNRRSPDELEGYVVAAWGEKAKELRAFIEKNGFAA